MNVLENLYSLISLQSENFFIVLISPLLLSLHAVIKLIKSSSRHVHTRIYLYV
jgi:hypothetical protein